MLMLEVACRCPTGRLRGELAADVVRDSASAVQTLQPHCMPSWRNRYTRTRRHRHVLKWANVCAALLNRLHGELAADVVRDSASAVQRELLECYALIERLGRGVVYYGSARLKQVIPSGWIPLCKSARQIACAALLDTAEGWHGAAT